MTTTLPETLPARWYTDPEIWQRERRAVFRRHWTLFARADQLADPGDCVAGDVAGWPVFALKARDGSIRAFHNVCRHRAAQLVGDGAGHVDVLRCPYHGWVYDDSGGLRRAPGFEKELPTHDYGLHPARADIWRGLIFVCLDDGAPDLKTWLGDIDGLSRRFPLERMRYDRTNVIELAANWKVYADNYAEAYHIPLIHPDLNRSIDMSGYRVRCAVEQGYQTHEAHARDGGVTDGLWLWKFPGLFLNIYRWGLNVARLQPLGLERVRLTYWYYFSDLDPANEGERDRMFQWSARIGAEDGAICESVQRNLQTGIYDTGCLSPSQENGVIQFQDWVRRSLAAVP
jgi:choline monooxygenase